MRKYLVGLLCMVTLTVGMATASAAIKSKLIGKKVDSVATVSINGKKIEREAVVIGGVSYLPVRDVTTAIGGNILGVKDGHITISLKEAPSMSEDLSEKARQEQERFNKIADKSNEIIALRHKIEHAESRISANEGYVAENTGKLTWGGGTVAFEDSPAYPGIMAEIEADKAEIARLEAEIATLEAELAALKR
jgi:peptidoglycan hydrolase CwlO-like protein